MEDNTTSTAPDLPQGRQQIGDWADLGQQMWSYLTGRGAAVNYEFVDMSVEVPRDIGPDAPRAVWKINGSLRVTTSDDEASGADPARR
ncbi:hypothetical protein [Arthrobacter sp. H14]|uniref:hypothetical protein n=1 Tax=Arthrobacter sp. H14 TaxID=1312959 RepID=UPI00047BB2FF|nr:hypothetical protein [Arthrobacter sp. H14]